MQASLEEVYIAPNAEISEEESQALKYVIGDYSTYLNNVRMDSACQYSTLHECLYASAHWLALLEPLRSTHYFLAEAMEEREDASDLFIHSSEIQQACKSVLAQMFLIACNIHRLEDDLDQHPELLQHMTAIKDRLFEEAGIAQPYEQLELF